MLYRFFNKNVPDYLARNYWWAYLWKPTAWFFDHQIIINLILFNQYKDLMQKTLELLPVQNVGRTLQLSCVYGSLTPGIVSKIQPEKLHLTDVSPLQLGIARAKLDEEFLRQSCMNVEALGYREKSFKTIIIFFLLHEMPPDARQRAVKEAVRVLRDDGLLILTEYAEMPKSHFIYKRRAFRFLLQYLEPFLQSYWSENIVELVRESAHFYGKSMMAVRSEYFFSGFYRITRFQMEDAQGYRKGVSIL